MNKLQKVIFYLFAVLLFFVPLVLWPYTSEVFEFNKMVLVYVLTTVIMGVWLSRCLVERRVIFRRTILDTPLLIFIGSQLISTVLSIDPLTSWLGYYSRFNGGFVSTLCYALLYWAFVSNFDTRKTLKLIYITFASAVAVCLYAVLEHFGIDKNIWVQDVQSRVFSTLGQPNWLAAWVVALMPIVWAIALNSKLITQNSNLYLKSKNFWLTFFVSILFFCTLLFTKSRSGLFGFGVAYFVFWILTFWKFKKDVLKPFIVISSSLLVISLISGTQFTPSLYSLINKKPSAQPATQPQGPALETGGTESGTIRRIVWKGAVDVWLHYSIFGTGVETFAYSYYKFRPAEHNLTSEWDFIYNKAHNEFLNFAANTGTVGLLSYLFLIGSCIYLFVKELKISNLKSQISNKSTNPKIENEMEDGKWKMVNASLLAGYASLQATNFFGFSVVPTQLEFFLFPAIASSLAVQSAEYKVQSKKIENSQKIFIFFVLCTMLYVLFAIAKYWYADTLYAKGKAYNSIGRPDTAVNFLVQAGSLEPNQGLFVSELANSYSSLAVAFNQQKDKDNTKKYSDLAALTADSATNLSPANVNLKRTKFGVLIRLATIDPNYLLAARDTLILAIADAPTDAKLYYNLGLTYARTGEADKAIATLEKTVELKSNYTEARLAYAYLLIDKKENAKAKEQLNYILENLDPGNSLAKQALEGIK